MDRSTTARANERVTEADSREVDLSDGTLSYTDEGAGEPLLFVHGAFVSGDLWRDVAGPLSGSFRCLVPTLPLGGHDVPMDPDADLTPSGLAHLLAEFCDALDLDRVTLVGNDTGGALCQVFLANYPDRVERLILTNCDAFDNFPPREARPFVWGARIPGVTGLFARSLRFASVRRLAFSLLTKHPIEPAVAESYTGSVCRDAGVQRDLRKALLGVSPEYTRDAAAAFPSFDRPVLLVWAPEDSIFPLEDAEALADRFPDARLETVADSHALLPEDRPERLVELIEEFVGVPVPA